MVSMTVTFTIFYLPIVVLHLSVHQMGVELRGQDQHLAEPLGQPGEVRSNKK